MSNAELPERIWIDTVSGAAVLGDNFAGYIRCVLHRIHKADHKGFPFETCPAWPCDLWWKDYQPLFDAAPAPSEDGAVVAAKEIAQWFEDDSLQNPSDEEVAAIISKHCSGVPAAPSAQLDGQTKL